MTRWTGIFAFALAFGALVANALGADPPLSSPRAAARSSDGSDPPVSLVEDEASFTLANGIVVARVDKASGTFSLKYRNLDVIKRGYWSQVGRSSVGSIGPFGSQRSTVIRSDPAKNGGERAEVSCRFGYDGHSPGLPCDVDMRFALGRGDHALYTYAVWEHRPGYPGFSVGEARMACKLNPDLFDFLQVDAKRRLSMPSGSDWDHGVPLNMKEVRRITTGPHAGKVEHKYDYSAILPDTPAYGWSSTTHHVGVWLINPSFEYIAGGPTKVELTGHLDGNPGGLPTLLNMWHGSHYGGSSLVVGESEAWTKVIGPFLLYCNSAPDHGQMWHDALAKARAEQQSWPYAWVSDPNYPAASERGTVTGTLVISDPQAPKLEVRQIHIGLASPPYTPGPTERGEGGGGGKGGGGGGKGQP
jgi:rhamnogalacturonan endolyase